MDFWVVFLAPFHLQWRGMFRWLIKCESFGDGRCFTGRTTQNLHYNKVRHWGKGVGHLGLCSVEQSNILIIEGLN